MANLGLMIVSLAIMAISSIFVFLLLHIGDLTKRTETLEHTLYIIMGIDEDNPRSILESDLDKKGVNR